MALRSKIIYKNIDLIMLSLSNFSEIDLYILDLEQKVNIDTDYMINKYGANIINIDSLDGVLTKELILK